MKVSYSLLKSAAEKLNLVYYVDFDKEHVIQDVERFQWHVKCYYCHFIHSSQESSSVYCQVFLIIYVSVVLHKKEVSQTEVTKKLS